MQNHGKQINVYMASGIIHENVLVLSYSEQEGKEKIALESKGNKMLLSIDRIEGFTVIKNPTPPVEHLYQVLPGYEIP